MSHFAVIVHLSCARLRRHDDDMHQALKEILAPFQENNMNNCPREFLEFNDTEDEYREEYDTESSTMIELADGQRHYYLDERFKKLGTGAFVSRVDYEYPEDSRRVEVPHNERWLSFDAYVQEWHGTRQRDPEKGRYGYWENANAKWDWYVIGGRWHGYFPVRPEVTPRVGEPGAFDNAPNPGKADIVQVGDIDFDRVAAEHAEEIDKFWFEYQQLLAGKKFNAFEGPRHMALRIGLLRVEQGPYPNPKPDEVVIPWTTNDDRKDWNDVALRLTESEFRAKYFNCFSTLMPYALLDDDGWHAPGEMGWFGCSSDEPDQYVEFADRFAPEHFSTIDPHDLLVAVDCHI
ncbi:MAG: hypothetical protein ACTHU0_09690 [Kofleriaceae bacterium]